MVAKKIATKVTKGGNKKVTTNALDKAKKDSDLVHKFLDLASHTPGAPKQMINVADKENKALKKGIKAARSKSL